MWEHKQSFSYRARDEDKRRCVMKSSSGSATPQDLFISLRETCCLRREQPANRFSLVSPTKSLAIGVAQLHHTVTIKSRAAGTRHQEGVPSLLSFPIQRGDAKVFMFLCLCCSKSESSIRTAAAGKGDWH